MPSFAAQARKRLARIFTVLSILVLSACTSSTVQLKEEQGEATPNTLVSRFGDPFECDPNLAPAPDRIQRLTGLEYENILRNIFGDSLMDQADIQEKLNFYPQDLVEGKLRTDSLTMDHVATVFDLSLLIAKSVSSNGSAMANFNGQCLLQSSPSESCVKGFIENLGSKLHRKPLTVAQVDAYYSTYQDNGNVMPADSSLNDRAEILMASMMMAPEAIYRLEVDGKEIDSETLELSSHDLANRLSFTLIGSMPDEELMARANDGTLKDDEVFREQVNRLLATPQAQEHILGAFETWMKLSEIPRFSYSDRFLQGIDSDGLKDSMKEEFDHFLRSVVFDEEGNFKDLLLSDTTSFSDNRLAEIYGTSAGTNIQTPDHKGILNRAIILSRTGDDYENAIKRAVFLREEFLCDPIPVPDEESLPPDFRKPPDTVTEHRTSREILEERTSDPACYGCHQHINPYGFAFNGYDGLGRVRTHEKIYADNGSLLDELVLNAQVELALNPSEEPEEVEGGDGIARAISRTGKGDACMIQSWFDFIQRRTPEEGDACRLSDLYRSMVSEEGNRKPILALIRKTVLSDEFRTKRLGD